MAVASPCNGCIHMSMSSILDGQRRPLCVSGKGVLWALVSRIRRGTGRQLSSSSAMEMDGHVPVLIVGAGPVGLVLSILLTKLGVKCSIIERNQQFTQHPQAHFINNRTMEVFRKLDGLCGEIEELQPPVEQWRKFIYCTTLSGSILGTVDHLQPQDFQHTRSPTSVAHFSQHRLVPLLLERLERLGFSICSGGIHSNYQQQSSTSWVGKINLGHECVSINATSDGIEAVICSVKDGSKIRKNVQCSFLIGADGAGSAVRRWIGIDMKGKRDMQKLISIHFLSKNLGHFLSENRPGMLYFVFNPKIIGVLVAHNLHKGEFVVQIPLYPPQQRLEDFTAEVCKESILNLVGHDQVDIDIKAIKQWAMHAEVAEKFSNGSGRIMLVGDAAHRFPPAGGFGMNTGIQDAHNLAWKLAAVLSGMASFALLDTYEMERKPIAKFNTALSVANFNAAMSVPSALGLNPTIANSVHRAMNSGIGSFLPIRLQRVFLESIFTLGRAQMSTPLLSRYNPLGSLRLAKVKNILGEGQSLQLQFPAEDLGFRYEQGALVPKINILNETLERTPTGKRREYAPSGLPGSRLPHMPIRILNQNKGHISKEICSTLDLVSGNMVEFLLIVAPNQRSCVWADAALKVSKTFKVPLKVCIMWPAGSSDSVTFNQFVHGHDENNGLKIQQKQSILQGESLFVNEWKRMNADFLMDVEEITLSWWELCKMSNTGAILVRPDEHIAWTSDSNFSGDPVDEINKVFSLVLKKTKLES